MKTSKALIASAATLIIAAVSSRVGSAQPSGSLTPHVSGTGNVLWDLSEISALQNLNLHIQNGDTDSTIDFADPFTQDGRGKLATM